MRLVKISNDFFNECRNHNVHKELMFNEDGRPSVLIVKLRYKEQYHKFVVPLRSNISPKTPKDQYFSLPPNPKTKPHHSHGIHYIKLFPIDDKYVQTYLISEPFDLLVKISLMTTNRILYNLVRHIWNNVNQEIGILLLRQEHSPLQW